MFTLNLLRCAWPVQEEVAMMMMSRLYKKMCDGNGENRSWKVGEHVGEGQRQLRELTDDDYFDEPDKFSLYGEGEGIGSCITRTE